MTPRQRLNLLNRFDSAVQEYAFRGAKHPEDAVYWEAQHKRLKGLLAKELGVELPTEEDDGEFD